jgi:hypothetical protein
VSWFGLVVFVVFVVCAVVAFIALLATTSLVRGIVRDRALTPAQRTALRELEHERREAVTALVRDFPRLHPELAGEELREATVAELLELERRFAQCAAVITGDHRS